MSRRVDRELGALLDDAMGRGSCLTLAEKDADSLQRALERRVQSGTVFSPARGLYVRADAWAEMSQDARTLFIVRGLQALHPNWVFGGPTAAVAYGVDVSWSLQDRIHLATTRAAHRGNSSLICRHAVLDEECPSKDIEVVGGVRVTVPERTIYDCLRSTDFPRGLGVADSAIRGGVVSQGGVTRYIEGLRDRSQGKAQALGTLAWTDPRSENGGESIARAHMLLLGYARPELQVEVPNLVEGGESFRADFCWIRRDGVVILGELDGTDKYVVEEMTHGRSLDEVLSDEKTRGSRITLYDVSVMRFRFGLTTRPERFAALLDEYGVPKRGSALAYPDNVHMLPDWGRLRRGA